MARRLAGHIRADLRLASYFLALARLTGIAPAFRHRGRIPVRVFYPSRRLVFEFEENRILSIRESERPLGRSFRISLPANAEVCDQSAVALDVIVADIVKQTTTLTHQHEQASATVMILFVDLQVLGEV